MDITPASVENRAKWGKQAGADNHCFYLTLTRVLGFKELKQDVTESRAAYLPTPSHASRHTHYAERDKNQSLGLKGNKLCQLCSC